jgi:hypothetical protein
MVLTLFFSPRSWDSLHHREDFMTFDHRGAAIAKLKAR